MFTQLPEHRALTGGGGLGIGLALSRKLVALHGGTIVANSSGLGHGSQFVVRLPLAAAVERAGPLPAPAGTPPPGPRPEVTPVSRRVLVVDDNVDSSEGLRALLELEGHAVEALNDGPSALLAVEWFAPEIVLLDIGLPGMDGYEVARRLRTSPSGRGLLLCAVTGWGQPADKERANAAGFDLHVTKPLSLQMLRGVLREAVRRDPARLSAPRAGDAARAAPG
jgi:two-component system, sensor histidine kinase